MEASTEVSTVKKNKTERINKITGIAISDVDPKRVFKACKDLELDVDDDTSPEQACVLLWTYINEETAAKDKVYCTLCLAVGDASDDECAFCGNTVGMDTIEEAREARAKRATKIGAKEAKMTTTVDETTEAKKKKNGAAGHAKPAAIVKDDTKPSSEILTERALDENVREVQHLKGEGAVACYKLGLAIANNIKAQLWKLRVEKAEDGKSKPRWATFQAFCKSEYEMTPQNAYILADVANAYSEPQVRAFGTRKLGLILTAPEEDRPALEEKAKNGASFREIAKEVTKVKKEKGHVRESRNADGRGGKRSSTQAPKAKAKTATITIANILGTEKVKLYKKPVNPAKVEDWDDVPRAKNLGHQPYGILELANGVSMHFTVSQTPGGELFINVVTKRDE